MNQTTMSSMHQSSATPWLWPVADARRLPAAPMARWLVVSEGCVWLTRSRREAGLSEDIWLDAGQSQWLPAGSAWVIEAWPQAQVEVLQAPLPPGAVQSAA
jgi:hypothetical protein